MRDRILMEELLYEILLSPNGEGITGYIYRNAYEKFFHNIDKYFTPFIVPIKAEVLKQKS